MQTLFGKMKILPLAIIEVSTPFGVYTKYPKRVILFYVPYIYCLYNVVEVFCISFVFSLWEKDSVTAITLSRLQTCKILQRKIIGFLLKSNIS